MTIEEKNVTVTDEKEGLKKSKTLILFNDKVNTFDFVIETLVNVCGHDLIQAENCTWIAHYKGKCPVKKGSFEALKTCYDEMINRNLIVQIQ